MMLRSRLIATTVGVAITLTSAYSASAMPGVGTGSAAVRSGAPDNAIVEVRRGRNRAFAAGAALAGVGILAGAAIANSNRYGYAEPYYYEAPPVYVEPPPVYYTPAPVYVEPPAHYYAPPPYYYEDYNYNYR
ncbi:hypothetical protein GCM10007276_25380 [Agaricicola taiwanensis]|uniref:Transmembrane protein n=1 Tax=Agaricicola taiwanensis TaxID=591372 RepID=A0A8J2YJ48_9RHOB|nr:hypothetical protein [Agaricicola taiwanensis]GGE47164.1 hypothetical protein GCM10007276_25380 [Agaricicola taiwanensis]